MSNSKKIIKNIFSLSVAEFASRGLQALFYLYLARVLSPSGLGSLGFAQSFVAYFVLFVKLGFDTVGMRAIAKNPDETIKIVNSTLSIRTLLTILILIIYVFAVFFLIDPLSKQDFSFNDKLIVLIAGINILAHAYLLNWVYIGLERMKVVAVRTVMVNSLNVIAILFFVKNQNDVIIAMSILALSNLVTTIYLLAYYIKDIGKIKWEFDKKYWSKISKASLTIGITFLIITLYNNLDVTMLRLLKNKAETGIYEAAHRILIVSIIISSVLQSSFFPQISKLKGDELGIVLKRYRKLMFLAGSALAYLFYVYSDGLIYVIGNEYLRTVDVLKVLSVTVILTYFNVSLFSPLVAWGHEKKLIWGNLLGLAFNLVLNLILIPKYGAIGAGIATISSELGVLVYFSYLYVKIKNNLMLGNLFISLFIAGLAFLPGIYFQNFGMNNLLSLSISFIMFIIFIFLFKIFNINEIKSVLKK